MSFHVFSFCCRRLNTVLNVPFFFGIHSIGVACFAAAGTHHPAVVYCSIFQVSSEWNASGHLGSLCLSCFDSLIKGICVILQKMEVTSIEVDLIDHCISQQFPHVVEEYLNMYIRSDFSLNPLVLGFDSSHCPSCHSFWDMTF